MLCIRQMLIILLFIIFLVACSNKQTPPPAPTDHITVQLKWNHQAQFAGFYVAQEEGYYAEENLDVTFVPGGIGVDLYEGLLNHTIDFSVVGADGLILQREQGNPFVAIATTYRINPFIMVTFADSDIQTPADFRGHTLSLSNEFDRMHLVAMMEPFGIGLEDITTIEYSDAAVQAFLDGDIDVITSFVAGSLIPLQKQVGDRELRIIWPGDFGVHFYSDTIISHESTITENPDLVQRFLRATLRGHLTAIEDPNIGLEATMQYAHLQDRTLQNEMLTASIPLIHTGEDAVGWMRAETWQNMHDTMVTQGILQTPLDVEAMFEMRFLYNMYGETP